MESCAKSTLSVSVMFFNFFSCTYCLFLPNIRKFTYLCISSHSEIRENTRSGSTLASVRNKYSYEYSRIFIFLLKDTTEQLINTSNYLSSAYWLAFPVCLCFFLFCTSYSTMGNNSNLMARFTRFKC